LRFLPYGPFTQQLIIHAYSDFDVMFSHFQLGEIDISDWPLQSQNAISTFCGNPDFFCTKAQAELGYFGVDVNSFPAFMGIPLLGPRTTTPATYATTGTAAGCSTGFGSLSITLVNKETGSTVLDTLSTLTAANQPSGSPSVTVSDSGGSTPNGVYVVPCQLAGSYSLRSNIYNATGATGTITVSIASATVTSATFSVNWNSPSISKPTTARALLGAAFRHLLDDPAFVRTTMTGVASAPCAFWVPGQGGNCPTGTTSEYLCQTAPACPTTNTAGGAATESDIAECQFGNHPWLNVVGCSAGATGHDVGPYHIADTTLNVNTRFWNPGTGLLVAGYAGHDDLRAACDDLVSMGLAVTPSTASCLDVANAADLTTDPGTYAHIAVPAGIAGTLAGQIKTYVRINFGRQQFGQVVADTLNFLFGTPQNRAATAGFVGTVCYDSRTSPCTQFTPKYYTFTQVTPIVFEDTPASGGSPNAWQFYTEGQGFDPTPDQYFINSHSINTGTICAGTPAIKPNNYHFFCEPQMDTDANAGEFAPTSALSTAFFQRAIADELKWDSHIPGFAFVDTFAQNNGWNFQQCTTQCVQTQASLVNTIGFGTLAGAPFFTLLNARQVPGYTASVPADQPTPGVIRRSWAQDSSNLSPFTFNSVWEGDFLGQVFDTMLEANPNTGGAASQFIDWGTTSHSATFSPTEVGCNAINGCATGVTKQIWHIRNDWKFSDGNDVKATDVAYTIIANRDVPSSSLQTFVLNVVSATGLDCGPGQPCKTLQVKLQGQSSLFEFNVGATQLVIEKSLWAPFCGDPPVAGGVCASPTFDPEYPSANSPGIEVGPGPWACIAPISGPGVSAGHIGGPCIETSTGVLQGGATNRDSRIFLQANTFMARCCPTGPTATSSSLYKLSYADHNNDGVVNILDLADVASHFGTADPYWVNSNIASGTTVGAVDLATVAIYFGHGVTAPFSPSTLTLVDPQVDPFFCNASGC
jgi:hypothetical protein